MSRDPTRITPSDFRGEARSTRLFAPRAQREPERKGNRHATSDDGAKRLTDNELGGWSPETTEAGPGSRRENITHL